MSQQPKKRFASRDDILSVDDHVIEELYIPEWDCWVRIRSLDARTGMRMAEQSLESTEDFEALTVAYSVVDEKGEPLFTAEDVKALARKRYSAVQRIARVANAMNRLGVRYIEAAAENFPDAPSGDLPSG